MRWKSACVGLGMAALLAGCQGGQLTEQQRDVATGAALGAGIGLIAGGSFGQVVGAGLVGGSVGYIAGQALRDE